MWRSYKKLLSVTLALATPTAGAASLEDVAWSGFLTAAGQFSNSRTAYDEFTDENGTFATSRFGLSFSARINPEWRAGVLLVNHEGEAGIDLDWGFATYQPRDTLIVNLGRIKYPNNLLSEYFDVGFSYPWIEPPAEFYSHNGLGPNLTAENLLGASVTLRTPIKNGWRYAVQPFVGENNHDDGLNKKLIGVKGSLSTDGIALIAGYSRALLVLTDTSDRPEVNDNDIQIWNAGAMYDRDRVVAYLEYGQSKIEDNPAFDSTGGYAMVGYRFGSLLPHVTYGLLDQDSGLEQRSVTLGLRYELSSFSALKFQWQSIDPKERGTAFASGRRPSGLFESEPAEDKVRVIGVAFDLVF